MCVFYELVFSEDGACNVATFMPESEEVGGACVCDGKKGNCEIYGYAAAHEKAIKTGTAEHHIASNMLNTSFHENRPQNAPARSIFSFFFARTLYTIPMHVIIKAKTLRAHSRRGKLFAL